MLSKSRIFSRSFLLPNNRFVPHVLTLISPPSYFSSIPGPTIPDHDTQLRHDIKLLGQILGQEVNKRSTSAFNCVERLRRLGREWRSNPAERSFDTYCIRYNALST